MNRKAEILYQLGEPLAAGMYEDENATIVERYGRGLRRYFEHAEPPPEIGLLYPTLEQDIWRLNGRYVRFHYSHSFEIDGMGLRRAGDELLKDPFEKDLLGRIVDELNFFRASLIAPRYQIGGNGWTHTVLNYPRILREGLGRYIERVNAMSASPLKKALQDVLKGIGSFLKRAPGTIREEVMKPAVDFRSAMRSFNFFFALDQYDSAGRFDDYMGEFYRGEEDAGAYVGELFHSMDIHRGWHLLYTSRYPDFTALCLRAQKFSRPNSGLLIGPKTPDAVWNHVFDVWSTGIPNPCLYNETAYRKGIAKAGSARGKDRERFVFGGCTELMFEGCSNIGSTEGGINLLEILAANPDGQYHADIKRKVEEFAAEVRLNSEFAARHRPQLVRTLFVDDCIDRELEYRNGGARYCGSIFNVAGLTNAVNMLGARQGLKDKFGNDSPEIDEIARKLTQYTFGLIRKYPMRGGGPAYPAVILLTGYAEYGRYIDATPDGRKAGAPVVDSIGAVSGTDMNGPTALLKSVGKLPGQLGLGTPVLNLRISRSMTRTHRTELKALIQSFFDMGGMQLQLTLIDPETLRKAYENPDAYPNLIVRIGGYSEYYHRLSRALQLEVLKRTEHSM